MSSAKSDAESVLRVEGRDIPLIVRRYAQARGYRLRYDASAGLLRLSMPARGRVRPALEWAGSQAAWVARQLAAAPERVVMRPGILLPVEGVDREICWEAARPRMPVLDGDRIMLGGPEESVPARISRWLKRHSLEMLRRETLEIAASEDLAVTGVAIGDPRGRWGSCSSGGAIRYSWRLILAPPDVRRATVAHEVAHLLHMDHSPDFHAAHRRLLGEDPRPARAWLKRHGAALHRFTA
ncbi:MAG: M48 family metallopeptidase [Sphingobium sp.]